MSQAVTSEIEWSNNLSILQQEVAKILILVGADQATLQKLLTEQAMKDYWIPAFTHSSVAPHPNNYESFEFKGDLYGYAVFADYLENRFCVSLTPAQGNYFVNTYMTKHYLPILSRKLGIDRLMRYNPLIGGLTQSIKEDVFESFMGALKKICDKYIVYGSGDVYLYNLIMYMFNDIPLSLDEVKLDDQTIIKELYDKMGWGRVDYNVDISDRPDKGSIKTSIINTTVNLTIGVGYGDTSSDSKNAAAKAALEYLKSQGITTESANQQRVNRLMRNAEYNTQHVRVEKAIQRLNEMSQPGQGKASGFEIKTRTQKGPKNEVTFISDLILFYPNRDGSNTLRPINVANSKDRVESQIETMKTFANKMGIPA